MDQVNLLGRKDVEIVDLQNWASLGKDADGPPKTCNSASTPWRQKKSSNGIRRASSFHYLQNNQRQENVARLPNRSLKPKPPSRKPAADIRAGNFPRPGPAFFCRGLRPTNQSAPAHEESLGGGLAD